MTTADRRIPLRVPVEPPEGGVRHHSSVKCEDIRSVTTERLVERWGTVSARTLAAIEERLQILLEL